MAVRIRMRAAREVQERRKMKTSSAKAKGRRLQQQVRTQLIEELEIHPEDIESRPMGSQGEDLIMSRAAREAFPYSIECKNQEKLNVWSAWEQAKENCKSYKPLVVMSRNRQETLVVMRLDDLISLHKSS